jgi:hypothetical protein
LLEVGIGLGGGNIGLNAATVTASVSTRMTGPV